MILKWKDWSGASHLIEGVEEAIGYARQFHEAEARAIAEHYDGEDVTLDLMSYPDIWYQSIDDAEAAGHDFSCAPVPGPSGESAARPVSVKSVIPRGVESSDPNRAPGGSIAVNVDGVRSAEALRVEVGHRSYGMYVIATVAHRDGSGRRRRHLFIDGPGPVYLMSETGSTVDRFAFDD